MSSMAKETQQRANLLQGTLDMLILRTLLYGPAHGHQIGKHIQRTTNDFENAAWSLYLASPGAKGLGCFQVENGARPKSGVQVLPPDRERPKLADCRRIAVEGDSRGRSAGDVASG
jgi:hypothetical protein